jgi:hypothetical protein
MARNGTGFQEGLNIDGPYGHNLEELKSSDVLILLGA